MTNRGVGVVSTLLIAGGLSYGLFFGIFPQYLGVLAVSTLLVLAALKFALDKNVLHYRPGLTVIWLVFAVFVTVSAFLSDDALQGPTVGLISCSVLLFFAVSDPRWLRPSALLFTLMVSVHVVATLVFYFFPAIYDGFLKPRFYSDVVDAVGYSSGLTPQYSYNGTYVAFAVIVFSCWAMWMVQNGLRCAAQVIGAFLAIFALILTEKRAHLVLALLTVLVVYLCTGIRGKFMKLTAVVVGAVCLLPVVGTGIPGIGKSLDRLLGSVSARNLAELTTGRTFLWEFALKGWRDHPVFGNGWNSFSFIWPTGGESTHAHNELFQLLYCGGVIGLAIALVAVTASLKTSFDVLRCFATDRVRDERYLFLLLAVGGQVFSLTYAFTTGTLFSTTFTFVPYLYFVAVGFSVSFIQGRSVSGSQTVRNAGILGTRGSRSVSFGHMEGRDE